VVCAAGLLLFEANGDRPLIKNTTLDIWERSFAVNTRGVFLCARAYVNHRENKPVRNGRFITFSSVAAQLGGYRSSSSYIAAKSAVLGFTKALAREVAHMGITVNSVAPGLIDTEMLRSTVTSSGAMQAAAANIPLGRIGTVQDVAAAVDYLASAEAGYITGSVIDVNGGYRMQ
jgi:NAD(P)-dependent dehydrogenase (short-subunit alcohol dehydrogenase family)